MPVLCTRAAATGGKGKRHQEARFGSLAAAIATLMVGGCAAAPPAAVLAPADPSTPVPAARYSSVTAPYTRQRPVEPLPWREHNERVAPQAGP